MDRCFNSLTLVRLAQNAESPPHVGLMRSVDPYGVHVVFQAVSIGCRVRCLVLFKVQGFDDPVESSIDMSVEDYNALPTAEEVLAMLKEVGSDGDKPA